MLFSLTEVKSILAHIVAVLATVGNARRQPAATLAPSIDNRYAIERVVNSTAESQFAAGREPTLVPSHITSGGSQSRNSPLEPCHDRNRFDSAEDRARTTMNE
jgi:hypothetical protein